MARVTEPGLINSNVLWGHVLRLMPDIGGILGYTIGNYLIIIVSLTVIHWAMASLAVNPASRILTTALYLSWIVLFPQFTITAGVSAIAAIALLCVYQRIPSAPLLLFAAVFSITGFLIRDLQFLLIVLVALPVILTPALKDRRLLLSGVITTLLLGGAWLLNQQTYQEDSWRSYQALNHVRTAYTDFDGAARVIESGANTHAGYSDNDIQMLRNWFFADRQLADPEQMQTMLDNSPQQASSWQISAALIPFVNFRHLWAMALAAAVLGLLARSPRVFIAWLIFLLTATLISYAGRIVPERLIIPVYLLLAFLALLNLKDNSRVRLAIASLVLLSVGNVILLTESQRNWLHNIAIQEQLAEYLAHPRAVVWGDAYRPEIVHRPLQRNTELRKYNYQAIGQSSLAPNTIAYQASQQDEGLVDLLVSEMGVQMIAFSYQLKMLAVYCAERHNRVLEASASIESAANHAVVVSNVRCHHTL